MHRLVVFLVGGLCALLLTTCSGAHNLLEGRVEANVAGHTVVVMDCYRIHAPIHYWSDRSDGSDGSATWRYAPCRDAVVLIQGDQLTVNDVPYGVIAPGDTIVVDHGVVYVNGIRRQST